MQEAEELSYIVPSHLRDEIESKLRNFLKSDSSAYSIFETSYAGVIILRIKAFDIFNVRSPRDLPCTLIDKEFANYILDLNTPNIDTSLYRTLSRIKSLQPPYQYHELASCIKSQHR